MLLIYYTEVSIEWCTEGCTDLRISRNVIVSVTGDSIRIVIVVILIESVCSECTEMLKGRLHKPCRACT